MHKYSNTLRATDAVLWVNFVFIGISALLMLYYVVMANSVATKNYQVQTMRDKIESLAETNSSLMSEKLSLESPAALKEFALARNLEEVRNIVYIFESKDVAKR